MATGTHEYVDDPRNAEILININGEFFPRSEAKDFSVRQRVYSGGWRMGGHSTASWSAGIYRQAYATAV